jgi:MSHA biogenesis protein MshL
VNRHIHFANLALTALLMTACANQPAQVDLPTLNVRSEIASERPNTVPDKREAATVESPLALTEDLLSLSSTPSQENRIDIEANERPAKMFFSDLGESQNINILVDPLISGNISLSLRNVTLKQVTLALRDSYGYEFEKTSYGYRVAPNQLATRVYKLKYLNLERSGSSTTTVGGDNSNTVTTDFSASSSASDGFWNGIKLSLLGFISNEENITEPVIINSQTGLLVVHATTQEHSAIARFLADAELIMQKQVIIEAKIVEVTLDNEFRSGINWSFFNDNVGSNETSGGFGFQGDELNGVGSVGGVFNLSLSLDNFTSMLQLLDHQGDVQVLSSPRVSTVNNQKAVIKVGTDEYFATVTSVSTGDEEGTTAPAVELEQFFSGIALDVTPQIANDDIVTLHVRPTVTEVVERTKILNLGNEAYSLPLAYSNIRESDSIIRAKSGQIIVIGGLLQQKQELGSTGLPWFKKVPVIRALFSQEREAQKKSELVILLKPTVYDEYTTLNEVDSILKRLD